jgi:N-acyl-L-homoserine lactone synthetase
MSDTPIVSSAGSRRDWSGLTFRGYQFALADNPDEIDQIHRLVYRTFVVEVKQHADPGDGRLIDKFHHKNRYLVAKRASEVCGMVAVHDQQPFSVADAIATPGILEGLVPRLLEVRLLAVEPQQRHRWLFGGLMWAVYDYAGQSGYEYLAISGLLERRKMYERMGFRSLGDPVRRGQASFVPMLLSLSDLDRRAQQTRDGLARVMKRERLPGIAQDGISGDHGRAASAPRENGCYFTAMLLDRRPDPSQ